MRNVSKLILILVATVIFYIFLVHEPAHYISCILVGGDATFGILYNNPAVNCVFNGASNNFIFFNLAAPYLVDLFVLLTFLIIKRTKWTYFLPTVAMMNSVGNGLLSPMMHVQIGNDFMNMASIGMLDYGLALVVLNVFVWNIAYKRDLIDKKKLQKIIKSGVVR